MHLLRAGVCTKSVDAARQIAKTGRRRNQALADALDAHHRRCQLFDLCCALHSLNLPVLVLLECFAWTIGPQRTSEVPLELQWRIAKRIKDSQ